jgi:N-acetylmuramoyl-L-alanine amidase
MPWSRCGLAALLFLARFLATPAAAATAATVAEQAAAQQSPAPAPAPAPPAARPQGQSPPPPPPAAPGPPSRFLVVLDAAHGGDDLGGHLSSGQFEKNANLALSVRLRSLLGARGIQVITTRESDQSVALDRRAAIANHAGAGACISLHSAETGAGVHLFVSSLAPAAPTRFVAWNTAQAGWVTRSLVLAGVLNSALLQAGMSVTLGRAPLPAIENMTCPALTIEIAPERDSEHKITAEPDDPDYQARVAGTLAAAILEWRAEGHQP